MVGQNKPNNFNKNNNLTTQSAQKGYLILAFVLICMAALSRLFPHIWNFTPIAAIALFAGANFKNKLWAFGIPMLCLFATDLILHGQFLAGIAEYPALYGGRWLVYLCFAMVVGIGLWVGKNKGFGRILTGSLVGSVLFFLITNFGSWLTDHQYYPVKNIESLMYSYQLGLPFFRGTLLGDLFFNGVLFGAFEFFTRTIPSLKVARQRVTK